MTVTPGGGDARPWWLPPSPPEAPPCPTHTRMPHCTRVQSAQSAHSLLPQGTHARDRGEAPHPASTPRAPAASARRSAPPADAVPRGRRRPGCGVCGAAAPLTSLSCDSSPRGHPAVCPFASLPGVCHAEGPRLAASAAVRRWPPRWRACGCSGTRPWAHVLCVWPGGQLVDLLGRGYLEVQLPSGVRHGGPGLHPSRQCPSARDPITPPGASRSPAERAGSFAAVSPTLGAAAGSPGVFASLRELEKGQGVPASRHVGSMCEKSLRSDLLTSSVTRYCPLLENLRNS